MNKEISVRVWLSSGDYAWYRREAARQGLTEVGDLLSAMAVRNKPIKPAEPEPTPGRPSKFDRQQIAEMSYLQGSGLTWSAIGRLFETTPQTVKARVTKYRQEFRK